MDSLGNRTAGSAAALWSPNSNANNLWTITAV
jgi:hypothetical protein